MAIPRNAANILGSGLLVASLAFGPAMVVSAPHAHASETWEIDEDDDGQIDGYDIDDDGAIDFTVDEITKDEAIEMRHQRAKDLEEAEKKAAEEARKAEEEAAKAAEEAAKAEEEARKAAEEAAKAEKSDSSASADPNSNSSASTDADGDDDGDGNSSSSSAVDPDASNSSASADATDPDDDEKSDAASNLDEPVVENGNLSAIEEGEEESVLGGDSSGSAAKKEEKGIIPTKIVKGDIKDDDESQASEDKDDEADDEEEAEEEKGSRRGSSVVIGTRQYVDLSTEKFIASIAEQARNIGQERNLYASVLIAQAILESGSGNSTLAQYPNFNLFGIKGSKSGKSVTLPTQEDNGSGKLYSINASFRVYESTSESIQDYADLLRKNPAWYSGAWKENAKSWREAALALQGTYATSTNYANSLASLIETYDLERFDDPLPYKVKGTVDNGDGTTRAMTMSDYTKLEAVATACLGIQYTWGGNDASTGFDCSALVRWTYDKALGIQLPRTTYSQQHMGVEVPLDLAELRMGDLLFFSGASHVAMYLGDGFFIHAPQTGDVVKITSVNEFAPQFARRIVSFEDAAQNSSASFQAVTDQANDASAQSAEAQQPAASGASGQSNASTSTSAASTSAATAQSNDNADNAPATHATEPVEDPYAKLGELIRDTIEEMNAILTEE